MMKHPLYSSDFASCISGCFHRWNVNCVVRNIKADAQVIQETLMIFGRTTKEEFETTIKNELKEWKPV